MGKLDPVEWATDQLKAAADQLDNWRTQADRCYAFYAADQWEEEDRHILEEERNRQAVTFDRITRTVNAVSGTEIQNRNEIQYYPRQLGKAKTSEMMNSAGQWVRDQCDAEHEDSEAFLDMLICGMGWTETYLDADDREPQLITKRADPLEFLWDYKAKRRNLEDTKWRARIKHISKEDLLERWPGVDLGLAGAGSNYLEYSSEPRDVTPPRYQEETEVGSPESKGEFELVQFEYWEHEPYYQLLTEQGTLTEFPVKRFEGAIKEYADARGLQYAKRRKRKYKTLYLVGKALLEEKDSLSQDDFLLQTMTGIRDRKNNTWFGLVTLMLDPQRWANKWLSEFLHISSTNSKGGLLAETDAFEDVQQAENSWAQADSITWLKSGGLQKIQEKSFGQVPAGVDRMLQYALEAINSVSGVNPEMLGLADRDQPGVLEESRKRTGITMVANFFDALQLYHKRLGRLMMELIRNYISDGRLIRLLGRNESQYVPLIRDELAADYDVIVDEAPSSPNVKERTFGALMQILPMAMQAGIQIPPSVLDYTPLPESLIEEWKSAIMPQELTPEQQQEQQLNKELDIRSRIAAVKDLEAGSQLKMATAEEKKRSSEAEEWQLRMQAAKMGFEKQMEAFKFEQQKAMEMLKAENEKEKVQLEAAKFGFEGQLSKERHEMDLQSMAIKNAHEIAMLKAQMTDGVHLFMQEHGSNIAEQLSEAIERRNSDRDERFAEVFGQLEKLAKVVRAPRKKEIVRDKRGRATHAIETVIEDE